MQQRHVDYQIGDLGDGLALGDVEFAIDAAFGAWENAPSDSPTFKKVPSGTDNTVSWQPLGTGGIVAFASISFIPPTKTIVAFNIVFNSDLTWSTSKDDDAFDVQNVATHEAGHVEGLGHVNAPKDGVETMYKFTDEGETFRRNLCDGDIAGIQALY